MIDPKLIYIILIPLIEIPNILFVYAIAFSPPNTVASRPHTF